MVGEAQMLTGETAVREPRIAIGEERIVTTVVPNRFSNLLRRVNWPAVIAGWTVAVGCQVLLGLLGAGIGLAAVDTTTPGNEPGTGFAIGAGIFWLISGLISMFLGGWVAGWLSEIRNGTDASLHGVLVWSVATVIGAVFVMTSAAGLIGGAVGPAAREMTARMDERRLSDRGVMGGIGIMGREAMNQAGRAAGANESDIRSNTNGNTGTQPTDNNRGTPPGSSMTGRESLGAGQDRMRDANASRYGPDEAQARVAAEKTAKGLSKASLWSFFALLLGVFCAAGGSYTGAKVCTGDNRHGADDQNRGNASTDRTP